MNEEELIHIVTGPLPSHDKDEFFTTVIVFGLKRTHIYFPPANYTYPVRLKLIKAEKTMKS